MQHSNTDIKPNNKADMDTQPQSVCLVIYTSLQYFIDPMMKGLIAKIIITLINA